MGEAVRESRGDEEDGGGVMVVMATAGVGVVVLVRWVVVVAKKGPC